MAKPPPALVVHALDLFQTLGRVQTKTMFGGWGFWCRDLVFAIAIEDLVYLKVDDENRRWFVDAGCNPFRYESKNGPVEMGYFHPPAEAMESPEAMAPWARRAMDAAVRAAARKKKPATKKPATKKTATKKPATKKK